MLVNQSQLESVEDLLVENDSILPNEDRLVHVVTVAKVALA
jgi:hypothetical protein